MVSDFSDRFLNAAAVTGGELVRILLSVKQELRVTATEIRLRINKPLTICCGKKQYFICADGTAEESYNSSGLFTITAKHMADTFQRLCGFSVYSYQKELKNGYITTRGGHRAGICGTAVMNDGKVSGMRDITSINIRISREIKDAAEDLYSKIGRSLQGILVAGEPSSGKTTVLRDLARRISLDGRNVTVIDERGELGGIFNGIVINDLGLCDILNGYPKPDGIIHAVRSMAPDVIVCDEIGTQEDCSAIERAVNSGVILIASIHADSINGIWSKPWGKRLIETGAFGKIAMLAGKSSPGKTEGIYMAKENKNVEVCRSGFADSGRSIDRIQPSIFADKKSNLF